MTTESQDLGLTSHPKDGAFSSIVSPSYIYIYIYVYIYICIYVHPLPGPHSPNSYLVPSGSRTQDSHAGGGRSNK